MFEGRIAMGRKLVTRLNLVQRHKLNYFQCILHVFEIRNELFYIYVSKIYCPSILFAHSNTRACLLVKNNRHNSDATKSRQQSR